MTTLILENTFLTHIETVIILIDLLRRFCRYLSFSVATALVTSRLDYCNSFLHSIVPKDIIKLQRVYN